MKKYITLFQLSMARTWQYRGMLMVYMAISLLNIFLSMAIWSVAYKSPDFRGVQSFSVFTTYFILTILISRISFSFVFGEVADEDIKRGRLSVFLLKPMSYFSYVLVTELPWRIQGFLVSLPIVGICLWVFKNYFVVDLRFLFLALGVGVIGYILSFLVNMLFAILTFWLEDSQGTSSLLEISWVLFSGVGLPVFFFPPFLRVVSNFLPFQYTLFFPVSVGLGSYGFLQFMGQMGILLGWIVMMFAVVKIMWARGLRKFTSEGI